MRNEFEQHLKNVNFRFNQMRAYFEGELYSEVDFINEQIKKVIEQEINHGHKELKEEISSLKERLIRLE